MSTSPICGLLIWLAVLHAAPSHAFGTQAIFATPGEAAEALIGAVQSGNRPLFLSIAGEQMDSLWNTGDTFRDAVERDLFLDAAETWRLRPDSAGADRSRLYVGSLPEPFPAPIVKTGQGWQFNAEAGVTELTARRIRRNERAVVELCRRLWAAEFAYLNGHYSRKSAFARKIRSTAGEHDGLFWSGGEDDESPVGPRIAAAAYAEHPPAEELRPLFGYYFRLVADPVREGFAFVAWPAKYGEGGVRSFLITQSGDLYVRDLGNVGGQLAEKVSSRRRDRGWVRLETAAAAALCPEE